jgi:hypothetical protein
MTPTPNPLGSDDVPDLEERAAQVLIAMPESDRRVLKEFWNVPPRVQTWNVRARLTRQDNHVDSSCQTWRGADSVRFRHAERHSTVR